MCKFNCVGWSYSIMLTHLCNNIILVSSVYQFSQLVNCLCDNCMHANSLRRQTFVSITTILPCGFIPYMHLWDPDLSSCAQNQLAVICIIIRGMGRQLNFLIFHFLTGQGRGSPPHLHYCCSNTANCSWIKSGICNSQALCYISPVPLPRRFLGVSTFRCKLTDLYYSL